MAADASGTPGPPSAGARPGSRAHSRARGLARGRTGDPVRVAARRGAPGLAVRALVVGLITGLLLGLASGRDLAPIPCSAVPRQACSTSAVQNQEPGSRIALMARSLSLVPSSIAASDHGRGWASSYSPHGRACVCRLVIGLAGATAPSDLPGAASPAVVLGVTGEQLSLSYSASRLRSDSHLEHWAGSRPAYGGAHGRGRALANARGRTRIWACGGLVAGLTTSRSKTAWPDYMLIRCWLAWRRLLPRQLMAFLADAHQRGVLRKYGSVYQFRHIDLQRRLASYPSQTLPQTSQKRRQGGQFPWRNAERSHIVVVPDT